MGAWLCCAPGFAVSGPFVPAGDLGLRHDVQLLTDYGVIQSTITAWPMSWDALAHDLGAYGDTTNLPTAVRATMQRVQARIDRNAGFDTTSFNARLGGMENPMAIRAFQYTPREDFEASAGLSWRNDRVHVSLQGDNASRGPLTCLRAIGAPVDTWGTDQFATDQAIDG